MKKWFVFVPILAVLMAATHAWGAMGDPILDGSPPIIVNKTANYTIPASEAWGRHIFTNQGATGAITFTLPDAVPGMKVPVILYEPYEISIDPYGSERILVLTDTNGDKITSDTTPGSGIFLFAISTTEWMRVGQIGPWPDAD